jgi:hypothetical protein
MPEERMQMNCQRFEELAPQIAHQELRDAEILNGANAHAASCASCNALLTEARAVAASLAALAMHDQALAAPAHMENSLRAAFAREHAADSRIPLAEISAGRRNHGLAGIPFRWAALSLLAAAIILAALFLPRVLNRNAENNRAEVAPRQAPSRGIAPANSAPVKTTPETSAQNVAASSAHGHVHRLRRVAEKNAPPEQTLTGFLALPFADDFSTIEYGAVVRMQMSRADLAWLGLPVPISDTGEKIVADLFVNGNGVPEAIRLVR